MIHLQINPAYTEIVSPGLLKQAAEETLKHLAHKQGVELTIVLDSEEYIQALNKQYRQIDAPTDVLSFSAGGMQDPESGLSYLGDIVIALPKTQKQAELAGHSFEAELQLLVVHGVLHLAGYDHADQEQQSVMWQAQATILKSIGVKIGNLPED